MMKQKVWKGIDSRAPCTFGMGIEEVEMCLLIVSLTRQLKYLPSDGPKHVTSGGGFLDEYKEPLFLVFI